MQRGQTRDVENNLIWIPVTLKELKEDEGVSNNSKADKFKLMLFPSCHPCAENYVKGAYLHVKRCRRLVPCHLHTCELDKGGRRTTHRHCAPRRLLQTRCITSQVNVIINPSNIIYAVFKLFIIQLFIQSGYVLIFIHDISYMTVNFTLWKYLGLRQGFKSYM